MVARRATVARPNTGLVRVTDKLGSDDAAHRTAMPSVMHSNRQYENNRAEASHQPIRQHERQMRRFKSTPSRMRRVHAMSVFVSPFQFVSRPSPRRKRSGAT